MYTFTQSSKSKKKVRAYKYARIKPFKLAKREEGDDDKENSHRSDITGMVIHIDWARI